jgi:hypothetical protein
MPRYYARHAPRNARVPRPLPQLWHGLLPAMGVSIALWGLIALTVVASARLI